MAVELAKTCDIGQGYNFKPDEHHTFGYLTRLIIGDNQVAPDIRIDASPIAASLPAVVAVLESVIWSTLPNENIVFKARVSVANMQMLNLLAMQGLKNVVVKIGFTIHEYDAIDQVYYPGFQSHAGTAPSGASKAPASDPPLLFAKFGKTASDPGLRVGSGPEEDPLGIVNHVLDLTLAPPTARYPQQILIQTSAKVKMVKPWGIPQS